MKNQQEIATPNADTARTERNIKTLSATRKITYFATLTAISLMLKAFSNFFSISFSTYKIGFSYLGWYLTGVVFGPFGAAAVAAITDVLSPFISPLGGAFNPLLTLGNAAAAFTFGLVFKLLPIKNAPARAVIGCALSVCVGTLGINTAVLYQMYYAGTNYGTYFVTRLPQVPVAFVNAALTILLLPVCRKLGLIEGDKHNKTKIESDVPLCTDDRNELTPSTKKL